MKLPLTALILVALLRCAPAAENPPVLRTCADVRAYAVEGCNGSFARIAITGVVQKTDAKSAQKILRDPTGLCLLGIANRPRPVAVGDKIAIRGHVLKSARGYTATMADTVEFLGTGTVSTAVFVRLSDLDASRHDLVEVTTEGTVIRAFVDDVDENYLFLLLKDEGSTLPIALPRNTFAEPNELPGARVRVRGIFNRITDGARKCSGPFVFVDGTNNVWIVEPPPKDPFAAPRLSVSALLTPQEIARLGPRTLAGTVLATWNGNRLMLQNASNSVINVELLDGERLPACGTRGVAVGYPETDFFRINLSNARFRPDGSPDADQEKPQDGLPSRYPDNHGRLFRITGIVRGMPSERNGETRMILDCNGRKVFIDLSSNPTAADGIPLDSVVAVTGRCLHETDNWRADNVFPRIRCFSIVPRSAGDLVVLKRPSWWTARRLMAVIGLLAVALLAFLLWNRALRRLVERRSRELYRTRHVRDLAELRTAERTRLAVELHDSISQNISGASMRVDAAQDFIDQNPARAHQCLAVASKTLVSCREELRNCIWDLRNNILDETSVAEAIRMTVQPHLNRAVLSIRFNVPRTKMSDNVLHALLRIIRELVSNAVRHGHATALSIAGATDGDKLIFSVTDNGCGFVPEDRPGVAEGHFGLQGIEERIGLLGGEMSIESQGGKGTKVKIWIRSEYC